MSKITDQNELKALQSKRGELFEKIQTFHSENEKNWTQEHEDTWKTMNADYDEVYNRLSAHQAAVDAETKSMEAAEARRDRLSALAGHGNRLTLTVQNRMKSGGTYDTNRDLILDGPLKGLNSGEVGALAVAGWMGGAIRNERQRAAMEACGVELAQKELRIDLLNTFDMNLVRAALAQSRSHDEAFEKVKNTLTTGTGSSGGYTFGTSFVQQLEIAMTSASGMLETAEVIRTDSGELMSWPTVNDTANRGRLVTESAASTATDPTFGQKQWSAYKLGSDHILVPQELLDDNQVNLAQVLPALLGERIGRGINYYCTIGTASSQPNGIVTASSVGVTAAAAAAITYDEIINLEHSVNRALRGRAGVGYMFNDTTLLLLRKLKDADNNYLWQKDNNSLVADKINGRPYTINDDMASPATTAKTVLFGALRQYKIRMVRDVRFYRLDELYRLNDQTAFVAFMRFDGNLLNAGDNPVKHLVQA